MKLPFRSTDKYITNPIIEESNSDKSKYAKQSESQIWHEYLDDVALNRWGVPGDEPTNKNYPPILTSFPQGRELFPIPAEQLTINGWQQNPGY